MAHPATTNWLSFSLTSPMEALTSSSSASHHHHHHHQPPPPAAFVQYDHSANSHSAYLIDGFFHHELSYSKPDQILFPESEAQIGNNPIPKLADFLGDSQTETQDSSSLTHIYDQGHASYFAADHQDLKAIAGFQSFSTNSGSEVDDSASMGRASQFADFASGGHAVDSAGEELGFSACATAAALSLGSVPAQAAKNAVVAVHTDCSTKKVADTFGQRTSIYRGVTRHRWTGRYEAHLWDNSCRREGQARKGRQVYLGGYDKEDKAARAYDLAALKYWGPTATTNFPVSSTYARELEEMKHVTKQEFIASLRRKSSGFSRGASIYRGVTRHHQQGRWQARIGRVAGNKDLYLGTFATEEEAAEAYDIAAIKFRGTNAVTNFEMNRYDVEAISNSNLPIGPIAKRLKLTLDTEQKPSLTPFIEQQQQHYISNTNTNTNTSSNDINFGAFQPLSGFSFDAAATALYHHHHHHHHHQNSFHHFQPSIAATTMAMNMSIPVSSVTAPVTVPAEFYLWPHQNC